MLLARKVTPTPFDYSNQATALSWKLSLGVLQERLSLHRLTVSCIIESRPAPGNDPNGSVTVISKPQLAAATRLPHTSSASVLTAHCRLRQSNCQCRCSCTRCCGTSIGRRLATTCRFGIFWPAKIKFTGQLKSDTDPVSRCCFRGPPNHRSAGQLSIRVGCAFTVQVFLSACGYVYAPPHPPRSFACCCCVHN